MYNYRYRVWLCSECIYSWAYQSMQFRQINRKKCQVSHYFDGSNLSIYSCFLVFRMMVQLSYIFLPGHIPHIPKEFSFSAKKTDYNYWTIKKKKSNYNLLLLDIAHTWISTSISKIGLTYIRGQLPSFNLTEIPSSNADFIYVALCERAQQWAAMRRNGTARGDLFIYIVYLLKTVATPLAPTYIFPSFSSLFPSPIYFSLFFMPFISLLRRDSRELIVGVQARNVRPNIRRWQALRRLKTSP